MENRKESDLPERLAKPALRALKSAGYIKLEQFTELREGEVLKMHGMGPKAIKLIREELSKNGLSFKK